jgi:hypothetical protein
VLEAEFILLEPLSFSRRIFIGSHSLPPPLWFAVSVLQKEMWANEKKKEIEDNRKLQLEE